MHKTTSENFGLRLLQNRLSFWTTAFIVLLFLPDVSSAQEWRSEFAYGPFEIYLNVDIKEVAGSIEQIAALDNELSDRFSLPQCKEKIKLYIFADVKSYTTYIQKEYPGAPMRRALFAMEKDKPGKVFTFFHNDFDEDLRHECTHALLHAKIGRLPIWIDEGLAEYFEAAPSQRVFKEPYFTQVKNNCSNNFFRRVVHLFSQDPNLNNLEKVDKMNNFYEKHYQSSWSWMNFMLNDPSRQKILANYLNLCKNADEKEKELGNFPSFRDLLNQTMPNYESEYKEYWKELKKPTHP